MNSTSRRYGRKPETALDRMIGLTHLEQQECPLFSLPPELRTCIYEMVFATSPTPTPEPASSVQCTALPIHNVVTLTRHTNSKTAPAQTFFALLSTCRRIYTEAAATFYALHVIQLPIFDPHGYEDNFSICEELVFHTSTLRLSGLTNLLCTASNLNNFETVNRIVNKTARHLPRLRYLTFHLYQRYTSGSDKRIYEALRREKWFLKRALKECRMLKGLWVRQIRKNEVNGELIETAKRFHDEINQLLPGNGGKVPTESSYFGKGMWDVWEENPRREIVVERTSWWVF